MPVRSSIQGIRFEWDAKKTAANQTKHGVDFEQACEAFRIISARRATRPERKTYEDQ